MDIRVKSHCYVFLDPCSKYCWLKIALPKDEVLFHASIDTHFLTFKIHLHISLSIQVKVYLVTELNYVLNKLTCLLFFNNNNIKASFLVYHEFIIHTGQYYIYSQGCSSMFAHRYQGLYKGKYRIAGKFGGELNLVV